MCLIAPQDTPLGPGDQPSLGLCRDEPGELHHLVDAELPRGERLGDLGESLQIVNGGRSGDGWALAPGYEFGSEARHVAVAVRVHAVGAVTQIKSFVVPTISEEGFEEFFERSYRRLAQAMLLMTGDRSEAEDLAQEAMARVYERWRRVRGMASPEGYLYRTALNLNRKRLRRLAVRRRHHLPGCDAARSADPLEAAEARADLLRVFTALRPGHREVLVLVDWLGLDAEEAGHVLGLSPASTRSRLHRARAAARAFIGGNDD